MKLQFLSQYSQKELYKLVQRVISAPYFVRPHGEKTKKSGLQVYEFEYQTGDSCTIMWTNHKCQLSDFYVFIDGKRSAVATERLRYVLKEDKNFGKEYTKAVNKIERVEAQVQKDFAKVRVLGKQKIYETISKKHTKPKTKDGGRDK